MRTLLISLFISLLFQGCKKESDNDSVLRTVTYTFSPGGANSQILYSSIQMGTTINPGNKSALYSVNDQVKVGDEIQLQMSTSGTPKGNFEIRVMYNGKQIVANANYLIDGAGTKYLILKRRFAKNDFN